MLFRSLEQNYSTLGPASALKKGDSICRAKQGQYSKSSQPLCVIFGKSLHSQIFWKFFAIFSVLKENSTIYCLVFLGKHATIKLVEQGVISKSKSKLNFDSSDQLYNYL